MDTFKPLTFRFTAVFLLLLAIPLITWAIGWSWSSEQTYTIFDTFLYGLTETGSAPYYAGAFSLFLAILLVLLCRDKKHGWIMIFLSVFILQAGTQVIKTGLKQLYKEPRPYMSYVVELANGELDDLTDFYQNKRKHRGEIIAHLTESDAHTPSYLKNHWKHETGYSFPSGHTIFAACWVFIFLGFLTREKHPWTLAVGSILTLWAVLMLISRLRLGMHFPIDLLVSTVFAYLANLLFFYALDRNDAHKKRLALVTSP